MAGQALRQLLDNVPLYTTVECKHRDVTMAVVTKMQQSFWVRIFTRTPVVLGKRKGADITDLEALLTNAGIPIDSGWELYRPT